MTKYMPWLDLETTGLDPQQNHIIEAAIVITDEKFNVINHTCGTVKLADWQAKTMNEWCLNQHTKSGLLKQSSEAGIRTYELESNLIDFINLHFETENTPVVCGSSVHFDMGFVKKHMPKLAARLHYRMIDVSSFKEVFRIMLNHVRKTEFKQVEHRALPDIINSIDELRYYMNFISLDLADYGDLIKKQKMIDQMFGKSTP